MQDFKVINNKKIIKTKTKKQISAFSYNAFMVVLCLVLVFPIIWTICSSFKSMRQIYSENPTNLIPDPFTMENYQRIFELLPMGQMILNGLFLAVVIPILSMIVSALAAFALSRLKFKGSNVIFLLLISTMMIPSCVTLIPNYMIIVEMGLRNTYWGVILPTVLGGSGISLFLFRQYFLTIPRDLENAAIIDGSSWLGVFFKIILPNSKPVIATVAILTFRNTWNSYLWPSLVLQKYSMYPLTVGLKFLADSASTLTELMAGSTLSIVPILVIYVLFQKYFTNANVGSGFAGT